jgi:hypothetical protein
METLYLIVFLPFILFMLFYLLVKICGSSHKATDYDQQDCLYKYKEPSIITGTGAAM